LLPVTIAIASGKGGAGKTTFAVNFATALNKPL
jgi:cellulose biosynthesis protein BcsQ